MWAIEDSQNACPDKLWKFFTDIMLYVFPLQEIKLDEYITHKFPLDKINDAFGLLEAGKCLRAVINMEQ